MKKFFDDNHANNRLSRCYIGFRTEGKWNVKRCDMASRRNVVLNDGSTLELDSPNVVVVIPELGYVNTKHQCIYLSRKTKRMWKAGLVPENLQRDYIFPGYAMGADDITIERSLRFILNKEYPDFNDAVAKIRKGLRAACAFSNKWAVGLTHESNDVGLYYRNSLIGYVMKDGVYVGDTYSALEEQFEEITGRRFIS